MPWSEDDPRPAAADAPALEQAVADFVQGCEASDLDAEARLSIGRLLRDVLSVQIGCSQLPWSKQVLAYAQARHLPGVCCVAGSSLRMSAADAVFVNSTYTHGFEYDDVHAGSNSHPGACVVPVALAVGQELGCTLEDLLPGIVSGYEVYTRIGALAAPDLMKRGFHPHAILSPFGAAAVVARMRRFDTAATLDALAIALSHASGTMEPGSSGGSVKRLHAGIGARSGMVSADLASAGITGPRAFLGGSKGFYQTFLQRGPGLQAEQRFARDQPLEINRIWLKPYCCCGCVHPYLDAVRPFAGRFDQLDHVDVRVQRSTNMLAGNFNANVYQPKNIEHVQFSLPIQLALALLGLGNGLSTHLKCMEGRLDMRPVIAAAQRIRIEEDPGLDARFPRQFVADLTLHWRDGRQDRLEVVDFMGTPENPMSEADQDAKFLDLTVPVLGDRRAALLLQTLHTFDTTIRIEDLMAMCAA